MGRTTVMPVVRASRLDWEDQLEPPCKRGPSERRPAETQKRALVLCREKQRWDPLPDIRPYGTRQLSRGLNESLSQGRLGARKPRSGSLRWIRGPSQPERLPAVAALPSIGQ